MKNNNQRGYTLIELIVSVGLFAMVMLLASGAYLFMIGLNRQVQGIATGVDNLSFAVETMARDIRTGSAYSCGIVLGSGDCSSGGSSFSFKNDAGVTVSYSLNGSTLQEVVGGGSPMILTDPSVTITPLMFYVVGTVPGDAYQPHVTIVIAGTVSAGAGKPSQSFTIETGATMRGSDL